MWRGLVDLYKTIQTLMLSQEELAAALLLPLDIENPPTSSDLRGVTLFTRPSGDAAATVYLNSVLHTITVPFAFMLLKSIRNLSLKYSAPMLGLVWSLSSYWSYFANYNKYSKRLTRQFGLKALSLTDEIQDGELNFFEVANTGKPNQLYYLIRHQKEDSFYEYRFYYFLYAFRSLFGKKQHEPEIRYDIKSLESLSPELKELIRALDFNQLTPKQSDELKAALDPSHEGVLQADEPYEPGIFTDASFMRKSALSENNALAAGAIFGWTIAKGMTPLEAGVIVAVIFFIAGALLGLIKSREQPLGIRMLAIGIAPAIISVGAIWLAFQGNGVGGLLEFIVIFSLFNYIKNMLTDIPVMFELYGMTHRLKNLTHQPYVSLILNTFFLRVLQDIAPALISVLTIIDLVSDLPIYLSGPVSLVLYPYMTSGFLIFTMMAARKVGLPVQPVNSLADSENRILGLVGELGGCRWWTLDSMFATPQHSLARYFLSDKDAASSHFVTSSLVVGIVLGAVALLYGATSQLFICLGDDCFSNGGGQLVTFFSEHFPSGTEKIDAFAKNNPTVMYLIFGIIVALEFYLAVKTAASQYGNIYEYVEERRRQVRPDLYSDKNTATNIKLQAKDNTPVYIIAGYPEMTMYAQKDGRRATRSDLTVVSNNDSNSELLCISL